MFKPGDKYIHFTKFGSINKGTVKYYGYAIMHDFTNQVQYYKYHIINSLGILLHLDGSDGQIYRVEKELNKISQELINKLQK
jgi:hypothetical protein